MGGACSTNGKDEIMHTISWLENLKGRYHSEDLGADEKDTITLDIWEIG
jgi:hypothetical protein